jgi:hypothetical protein
MTVASTHDILLFAVNLKFAYLALINIWSLNNPNSIGTSQFIILLRARKSYLSEVSTYKPTVVV